MNNNDVADATAANPYAPPQAPVLVRGGPLPTHDLGSRGARLGARLIDGVIAAVVVMVPIVLFAGVSTDERFPLASMGAALLALLGLAVVNCVLLHRSGQTLGKKLVGVRIVRSDRSRCDLPRLIFVRILPVALVGAIPFIGSILVLVDALMIFGDDRRTVHDRMADTVVVTA
jgi:uncharacterized RDD family membrane protein YckC